MAEEYIVEPGLIPWRGGQVAGITFKCQVLLSGADGGPEALRFRFDPCPSVFAHMHLTVLGTTIRFIRPDVAAVDVKWEQTGAIAPDGKPWGTRKGLLSWVVTRENNEWLISVWHNLELPPYYHTFCSP